MLRYKPLLILLMIRPAGAQEKSVKKPKVDDRLVALPHIAPTPSDNPTTPEKVSLGKQLFFDPRLSGKNAMGRSLCHVPQRAFGDSITWNKGESGLSQTRNSQTILNVQLLLQILLGRPSGEILLLIR